MDNTEFMLTTKDNPWNPITDWDHWYAYDEMLGYHTSGLIARLYTKTPEFGEAQQLFDVSDVYARIIEIDALGVYRIVKSDGSELSVSEMFELINVSGEDLS